MMLETFFDSEYLSQQHSWQEETLTINLELWNSKPAKIVFVDIIGFQVFSICDPIGLKCEMSPSQFFRDALAAEYEKAPEQHDYKCYEIINVDEIPFIKVVAKGYEYFAD